jgi:eukaryotic-like serine/threonine-protein kinase
MVTGTAGVLGTAAYPSPEQASGRPTGSQADLYAPGCVLFEMPTGAPPSPADSAVGVAYRQVYDHPGPPSARRPGLPARLVRVTGRLLGKDPADRPASAAATRAGLLATLAPDATAVLPAQIGGPVPDDPVRRRRARPARTPRCPLGRLLAATGWARTPPTARRAPPATRAGPATRGGPPAGHCPAPAAAAACAFVGELQAGVADGQVTQFAG